MKGHDGATVVLEPAVGWSALKLGEVWQSHELMLFLAWRDIKVRYAQAALGVAWAVIQPLLMMVVFTVFLGHLAKIPSDGVPYAVFAFAGLVPWILFANATGGAAQSLVGSANLVSRVWFPRLVLPGAALLSFLPDVAIASLLLIGLMIFYGMSVPVTALMLPLFVAFALLAAASVGVWLSALNVAYRDVRYAVPFVIQLWLFATPVAYPASLVPAGYRDLLGLNPMAGVVEGFRWALLGQNQPPWALMGVSALVMVALLVTGLYYFRRVEHGFADVI
ncbi:MAG: ABC transporter permease [Dermatophilaceae bacterium]